MRSRGRPRKPPEQLHENRLELNVSDYWLRELMEFAEEHDLPPRTAARVLLVGALKERQRDSGTTLLA